MHSVRIHPQDLYMLPASMGTETFQKADKSMPTSRTRTEGAEVVTFKKDGRRPSVEHELRAAATERTPKEYGFSASYATSEASWWHGCALKIRAMKTAVTMRTIAC